MITTWLILKIILSYRREGVETIFSGCQIAHHCWEVAMMTSINILQRRKLRHRGLKYPYFSGRA